jgi:hypothetical protein
MVEEEEAGLFSSYNTIKGAPTLTTSSNPNYPESLTYKYMNLGIKFPAHELLGDVFKQ